jgi:hypothetical protein
MRINLREIAIAVSSTVALATAAPEVSFTGVFDGDVWADMKGGYYTNSEIDLGMTVKFSDNVSGHLYTTAWSAYAPNGGGIPARLGMPNERWVGVAFDGLDITYTSKFGTFTVGDQVFQYGKFNYYYNKRLSMITPESFTRGLKYSLSMGPVTQDVTVGVTDLDGESGDIQGVTNIALGEKMGLTLMYGARGSTTVGFENGADFFAGLEFKGSFGSALSLKADVGYLNMKSIVDGADTIRPNVINLLVEPTLTFGKFTTAITGFLSIDEDNSDTTKAYNNVYNLYDSWFLYAEPGYTFTDNFAFGLPVEYHGVAKETGKDNEVWLVPTFYVYPAANVQWWIWGQVVFYADRDIKNAYGLGSEVIFSF